LAPELNAPDTPLVAATVTFFATAVPLVIAIYL
jgi:hypothetical protein